jgi:release factor glutamine methyltransferase
LLFYQAIADFALKYLDKNGKLYFEINEYLGEETKIMLENRKFSKVKIYKDLHNKDRICVCELVP